MSWPLARAGGPGFGQCQQVVAIAWPFDRRVRSACIWVDWFICWRLCLQNSHSVDAMVEILGRRDKHSRGSA